MNIGKQITKAMNQIEARIKQKQKDIKESHACLNAYEKDKVTCAYNKMAIACWKEEINALREIYVTLKATEEIKIAFYDLNKEEFINNAHFKPEIEAYAYIDPKTETIKTWYKKHIGATLHELKEYGENWYYYYSKETKERRYVYQKKELYRDEYNGWEHIE